MASPRDEVSPPGNWTHSAVNHLSRVGSLANRFSVTTSRQARSAASASGTAARPDQLVSFILSFPKIESPFGLVLARAAGGGAPR